MRLLALVLLIFASDALAQLTPSRSLAFDFPIAQLPLVSRFEMSLDNGAFFTVGIPTIRNDANTGTGDNTHAVPATALTLSVGNHVFTARACDTTQCYPSAPAFAFTYSVPPPPPPALVAPDNLRVVP